MAASAGYIEKAAALAIGACWFGAGKGGAEAIAAIAGASVGLAVLAGQAIKSRGPESRARLRAVIRRTMAIAEPAITDLTAQSTLNRAKKALDQSLEKLFLDPSEFAQILASTSAFQESASDKILSKLQDLDPLFKNNSHAQLFAKTVISSSILAAYEDRDFFSKMELTLWSEALTKLNSVQSAINETKTSTDRIASKLDHQAAIIDKLNNTIDQVHRNINYQPLGEFVSRETIVMILDDLSGGQRLHADLSAKALEYVLITQIQNLKSHNSAPEAVHPPPPADDQGPKASTSEASGSRQQWPPDPLPVPSIDSVFSAQKWIEAGDIARSKLRYSEAISLYEKATPFLNSMPIHERWRVFLACADSLSWREFHERWIDDALDIDDPEYLANRDKDIEIANSILAKCRSGLSSSMLIEFQIAFEINLNEHLVQRFLFLNSGITPYHMRLGRDTVEHSFSQISHLLAKVMGKSLSINIFGMSIPMGSGFKIAPDRRAEFVLAICHRLFFYFRILIEILYEGRCRNMESSEKHGIWYSRIDEETNDRVIHTWKKNWDKRISDIERMTFNPEAILTEAHQQEIYMAFDEAFTYYQLEFE